MPKKVQSERKESGKSKSKVDKLEAMYSANPQLRNAVAQIEKSFGQGAIMPLSMDSAPSLSGISTGSLSLDMALGGCGIPHGRVIEIFGPESSGKTTLTLHVVASCQKAGGIAAFIDAEHAFDPSWAKKLGVDLESLLVSQPGSGEEALQIAELLLHSNAIDLIVIDSVAALVPEKELSGEIGDQHVGLVARLMSQSLRKLTALISKCKTAVVFINQIRDKIGMVGYGSPETTPGGRALKFFASQRLDVRRVGQVKDGEDIIGQRVKVKVAKNKVAPPFRSAEFDMLVKGKKCGISAEGDILDLALAHKLVTKSGAWFKSGDQQIAQGREKVRQYMIDNPDFTEQLRKELMAKVNEEGGASVLEVDTEEKAATDDF